MNKLKKNKQKILSEIIIIDDEIDDLSFLKEKIDKWIIDKIINKNVTHTKIGSILYLLYGKIISEQSLSIKLGYFGEFMIKELVKFNNKFELLTCGIHQVKNKKKDIDLIFKDKINNIIYYRELKANIDLDTEKLPATISKCKEIEEMLKDKYKCIINCGILNWTVYSRIDLSRGLSNIRRFEKQNIKIEHIEDFLKIIEFKWDKDDFYNYFRIIGNKIRTNNF